MGAYKEISKTFKNEYKTRNILYKKRIIKWNSDPSIVRIAKPTNLPRARTLGYKAIKGVITVRVKIKKGKRKRQKPGGGRKPSKSGRFFSRKISLQSIAEVRAAKRFRNCEVLNSYFVGETGQTKFYEVILLDKSSKSVVANPLYKNIVVHNKRAMRGLTASGKRHRGLRKH